MPLPPPEADGAYVLRPRVVLNTDYDALVLQYFNSPRSVSDSAAKLIRMGAACAEALERGLTSVELIAALQSVSGMLGFRVSIAPMQLDRLPPAAYSSRPVPPAPEGQPAPVQNIDERHDDLDSAFKDFLVDEPGHTEK